jgi:hypothetical protein
MRLSALNKKSAPVAAWRRQIGRQLKARRHQGPRPFAAVSLIARSTSCSKLINIRQLAICVLHDVFEEGGYPRIRFAAYRIGLTPFGISIGGQARIILDKDLALGPKARAFGRRFATHDGRWLPIALRMDRCVSRHARHPYAPRQSELRLPSFWASLTTSDVHADGPELDEICRTYGLPADVALLTCARRHKGQVLFPVEFVSGMWRQFKAIFADLKSFIPRQVIRLEQPERLCGFNRAAEFDLLNSPHQWRS